MKHDEFAKYGVAGAVGALVTLLVIFGSFAYIVERNPHSITAIFGETWKELASLESETTTDEDRVVSTVEKANPAVVAITVSKNVPVYERYYEENPWSPLSFFFSVPYIRQRGTELQEVGGGSGFLVSSDGYIVTNRHVVADETAQYAVFTNDGARYEARIVARDPFNDVAVIKIEGEGFEHLTFGDSDTLRPGQSVIAIGNALAEFRNTVSVGVISGLSRSIVAATQSGYAESLEELIQTDAAINEGNSGGPLLNLKGEVVGVNVAIVSGAQNVGFALSSNSVIPVVDSVKETGRIVRPYLGVRYVEVTPELQEQKNLPVDHGALVQQGSTQDAVAVLPNSPAARAGIKEGDIITTINGQELAEGHKLASILRTLKVGDQVRITIRRKEEELECTVVLEEFVP